MLKEEIEQVKAIARQIAKEEIAAAFKGDTPLAQDEAKQAAKEARVAAREAREEAAKDK
jgi:hypothetical protein